MIIEAFHDLIRERTAVELSLAAIAVLALPAMSLLFGLRSAKSKSRDRLVGRYLQTMTRGWLIAGATLLAWQVSGRQFAEIGLAWPPGPGGAIGHVFAALGFVALLYSATVGFRPGQDELARWRRALDALRIAPRSIGELLVFIPVAVTAGVWEELFYRGFLMWFFEPIGGVVGAALISSLVFGAGHAYQGLQGVVRTTLVGFFFAVAYAATGSLWWLMILHAAVDVFAGVLAFRVYAAVGRSKEK